MELFKGYVPTKNKKCTMNFKNADSGDLLTYDQVSNLPEYAGILSEDTILIDIDDKKQSDILLKIVEDKELICRVYQTTKGKHFLFRNTDAEGNHLQETCKTKCNLACGLTKIDIKVGHRNSYSVLKFNDKERKILYDKLEEEDYQEVPKWLLPIRSGTKFAELESGDGRNQALFNYILTLQSADFTIDECRECIRIINKYVLPDPLEEPELEIILRDDAFAKPVFFGKNGTFLFDKFATYLKNSCHIIRINGQLSIYKDGIYKSGTKAIEAEMIKHISNLNRSKRAEVLSHIELQLENQKDAFLADARYIAFKNGVFDIVTDEFVDFSPDFIITNKINHNYTPDAYSEICDKTLNKLACGDKSIRALLEELIGFTFYRRNELRKAFVLTGDKMNGKSTYLDMVKCLLGDENTAALDLKELDSRFKTAELVGKLANIGDDIGDEFIANPAIFKKLVSGNPVNVERKGGNPFDFSNYSKLLFSANSIPRIRDKSGAVLSRLIIIPFNAVFSKDDPDYDAHIKYKLHTDEVMEYLIQLGIQGLKRILTNQEFTQSAKAQKELQEYAETNNPVLLFFKEDPKILNESTKDVYRKYSEFCLSNGFQQVSHIEFSKQVGRYYGVTSVSRSIQGVKVRIFVEKEAEK